MNVGDYLFLYHGFTSIDRDGIVNEAGSTYEITEISFAKTTQRQITMIHELLQKILQPHIRDKKWTNIDHHGTLQDIYITSLHRNLPSIWLIDIPGVQV